MIVAINASANETEKNVDAKTKRERAGEAQKTRQRHLNAQPLHELSNWNGCKIVLGGGGGGVFSLFLPAICRRCCCCVCFRKTTKNDMTFQIFNTFLFGSIRSDTYANFSKIVSNAKIEQHSQLIRAPKTALGLHEMIESAHIANDTNSHGFIAGLRLSYIQN